MPKPSDSSTGELFPNLDTPPSVVDTDFTLEDPDAFKAFGSCVKTYQYDPDGIYRDIAQQMGDEETVSYEISKVNEILFSNSKTDLHRNGVLLTPREYTWVARPPILLAKTAARTTLNAGDINDDRIEASGRAMRHSLDSTLGYMGQHLEGLRLRLEDIQTLLKEANSPGYAHYSGRRMNEMINSAWQEFLNIADVCQLHEKWDDSEKQKFIASAILKITSGGQNVRVKNWQELLALEKRYVRARIVLIGQASRKYERELDNLGGPIES